MLEGLNVDVGREEWKQVRRVARSVICEKAEKGEEHARTSAPQWTLSLCSDEVTCTVGKRTIR